MKPIPDIFGFYAILTDPVAGYERVTAACVEYGIAFVQLRMKNAERVEILKTAKSMRSLIQGSTTRFIVNDHPDIAAEVGADGVHIGQGDASYIEARRIVGEDAIIGISTHSVQQTIAACACKPDYIGVGPLFPTPTKVNADPAIGLDGMTEMLKHATVPAVVLGSITLELLPEIYKRGARNFAMVRPIITSPGPTVVIAEILQTWSKCRNLEQ